MPTTGYQLVRLPNGRHAVRAADCNETMHPGPGPEAEAELLYVRQLRTRERMGDGAGEFVVWDVGLGAVANALAVLRATRDLGRPLRIESFDNTFGPLAFAIENATSLGYLAGYEPQLNALLTQRALRFTDGAHEVNWRFHLGDFPSWVARASERGASALRDSTRASQHAELELRTPPPHSILYDAFSPAKNPAMWTLPLFIDLFRLLDPSRPCALATSSRSTLIRVTLLLAGFFVGRGRSTGDKEETTVAANTLDLIAEPLDRKWLERARRSHSAEPLRAAMYRTAPVSSAGWEELRTRAQFR